MSLNFEELRELLQVLGQTDIAEVTLKNGDFELTVRKAIAAAASPDAIVVPQGGVTPGSMGSTVVSAAGMTAAVTSAPPQAIAPPPVA